MMHQKWSWKTAVWTVVAVVAVTLFAFRAAEWTRGLGSEFVVLGQTEGTGGGTGGATGTTPTVTFTVTKILPQIAVGSFDGLVKYTTIIEIVNTSSNAAYVRADFYNSDGTASALTFGTNLTATPTFTKALDTTSIAANGAVVIKAGDVAATTPSTGSVNWVKIQATEAITVATFFEIRDSSTNVLVSRVGVSPSASNLTKFVIPRVRNVAAGFDVAFALVNTGSTLATYTATLKDTTGTVVATKTNQTLEAGKQKAQFAYEFFGLSGEAAGTNYSYIVFEGSAAQFAALAIAFEGATQTSFPVDQLQ